MGRTLHMQERRVVLTARAEYLAALPARKARAAERQAHFWVFEHRSEAGRFVEFTEATREEDLAALVGPDALAACWGECQGG